MTAAAAEPGEQRSTDVADGASPAPRRGPVTVTRGGGGRCPESSRILPYPPVTEMVLDLQMAPLTQLQATHVGVFWEGLREQMPTVQEHEPLTPEPEVISAQPRRVQVHWRVMDRLPMQRTWLVSESGNEVLQIQQDRFIRNWRRVKPEDVYPSFERLKADFGADAKRFDEFLGELKLGRLEPVQCEVTYINHFAPGDQWSRPDEYRRLFSVWGPPPSALGEAEKAGFYQSYLMREGDAVRGRLHIHVEPANRIDAAEPIYVLRLTARGQALGEGLDGVLGYFDIAHTWCRKAFDALLTDELKAAIGEQQ